MTHLIGQRHHVWLAECLIAATTEAALSPAGLRERVGRGCFRNGTIPKRTKPSPGAIADAKHRRLRERRPEAAYASPQAGEVNEPHRSIQPKAISL